MLISTSCLSASKKGSAAILMTAILVMQWMGVRSVADCPLFTSTCQSQCQQSASKASNGTCNTFSASCSCFGAYGLPGGASYCSAMQSSCAGVVCGTTSMVDSFSCDPSSFTTQCQCKSGSSLTGGPMMGQNDTTCANMITQCQQTICQGKQVIQNSCATPATAVCQCQGGQPIVGNGTANGYRNGAASLGDWTPMGVGLRLLPVTVALIGAGAVTMV